MQFGVISLILVQLGFVAATVAMYLRMRAHADVERTNQTSWGMEVKAAVGTANTAAQKVDMIELEHYKNLRSLFESQALQLANCRAEIERLQTKVETLEVKVASLNRMDRRDRAQVAREEARNTPEPKPAEGDGEAWDALKQSGVIIPLNHSGQQPKSAPRPTFGQAAK